MISLVLYPRVFDQVKEGQVKTFNGKNLDPDAATQYLLQHGYLVVEDLLGKEELMKLSADVDELLARERNEPFDPGDGPRADDDDVLENYMADNYKISKAEHNRIMKRIRYDRAQNLDTPWPTDPSSMNKAFFHVPTLFDNDKSQRINNLPNKLIQCGRLMEDSVVLNQARAVLGKDCLLSDIGATSIGPQTDGGAWHIDTPLTQMPEPLPDIPIAVQNVWMLDDFTSDNGATQVVPGSHLTRKKPSWGYDGIEGEIKLTAPAGSMAFWLSHTWHRSGPNTTSDPRRAILAYYTRSWVSTWSDFPSGVSEKMAKEYSPTARYLMGWSAKSIVRG